MVLVLERDAGRVFVCLLAPNHSFGRKEKKMFKKVVPCTQIDLYIKQNWKRNTKEMPWKREM